MNKVLFAGFALALLCPVYSSPCSLVTSAGSPVSNAVFQCSDGSTWMLSVDKRNQDCTYRRFIIASAGQSSIKETKLLCNTAYQFIQDLVSNVNIKMFPDDLLPVVDFDNMQPGMF